MKVYQDEEILHKNDLKQWRRRNNKAPWRVQICCKDERGRFQRKTRKPQGSNFQVWQARACWPVYDHTEEAGLVCREREYKGGENIFWEIKDVHVVLPAKPTPDSDGFDMVIWQKDYKGRERNLGDLKKRNLRYLH